MKKLMTILTISAVCLTSVFAQGAKQNGGNDKNEVVVFAAASLKESLTAIQENYKKINPNMNIIYNFDSSGTLRTQIINGAKADVFISAGQSQMNDIQLGKNSKGNDFVDEATRVDALDNKVVLATDSNNRANLHSFDDLADKLKSGNVFISIGNNDVPVGQYTKKIFNYYKLDENDLNTKGTLSYASNVKEVTTQVKEGVVDAGIVYSTDAYSAGLNVVATATKEMCGEIIYPMAILKSGENRKGAEEFVAYLKTPEAKEEFSKVGFVPLI